MSTLLSYSNNRMSTLSHSNNRMSTLSYSNNRMSTLSHSNNRMSTPSNSNKLQNLLSAVESNVNTTCMFLFYINDIVQSFILTTRFFADD